MSRTPDIQVPFPSFEVLGLLQESFLVTEAKLDLPGPRILYVNPAFTCMTGYCSREIVGQTPCILQGPETDRRTIARMRRCLQAGEAFDGETTAYRKDGTPFVMRWYVKPIRSPEDRITHFFAVQRDVTEDLETSQQHRALEQTIGQLDDCVVLFGRDGRVRYVNAAFHRRWGTTDQSVVGEPVWRLPGAPEGSSELRWARRFLSRGRVWQREYAVKNLDSSNERHFVFAVVSPIRGAGGEIAEYLAVARDVTELRRLKTIAEAHNFHDHLGVIFSGIRHELGNPINSIKAALQVVTGSIGTMQPTKLRDYLERMGEEVRRVEYLLRSLRSYSLYERPRLEPVDLRSFLSRFRRLTRDENASCGVRIDVTIDADADTVWADPQALHQVLLNLIGNATGAIEGREGGRVEIRAGRRGRYCSLTVRDNGPGIPPKHLPHVFQPFYTTRSGGTGLGLPISKHLLSLMRGSIELSSTDAGTEAHILLDRREPAGNARRITDGW